MADRGRKKALIIGIDGVPFPLLEAKLEGGVMPSLGEILQSGYSLHRMKASLPDISSVSWTSFMTGVNPGEHAVFGFTHLAPRSYRLTFPNALTIKAQPFWQTLHRKGRIGRSVILNIPNTYPALPLAGLLVAGFVAPDFNRAVYPPSFIPYLKNMKYVIDVDMEKATVDKNGFLADLNASLLSRALVGQEFLKKNEWDTFLFCITETDRLHHFFFGEKDSDLFDRFYSDVDRIIGTLYRDARERFGDDLFFMLLSDHGFTALEEEVNINAYLQEQGFLVLDRTKEFYEKIATGTTAFAMDPGRIYLHDERYPLGTVRPEEKESLVRALMGSLEGLTHKNGRPVIREIFRKEAIYSGPFTESGPDLVCIPHDGFDLKGNMRRDDVFSTGHFSGMHTRNDAVLVIPGSVETGADLTIEAPAHFIMDYFSH